MNSWSDVFAAIKTVVDILFPIVGAILALIGLNTWKRQLRGSAEYDLSRRFLRAIYKYRNAIQGVRNPAIRGSEQDPTEEMKAQIANGKDARYFGISIAYQKRWDKVVEMRDEVKAELLEAEVIWGKKFTPLVMRLFTLEFELHHYLTNYLLIMNPDEDTETKKAYSEINLKARNVLYSMKDESKDPFAQEFNAAIESIENECRRKLRR